MANEFDGFTFGPYYTSGSALHHLQMFHALAFPGQGSADWGIVWSEHGRACVLQQPAYDGDGHALALAYEWTGSVPALPAPASLNKSSPHPIKAVLEEFFTDKWQTAKAATETNIINPAISKLNAIHNVIVDHPKTFDGINIILDAYGTVTGIIGGVAVIGAGSATSATVVAAPVGVAEITAGVTATAAGAASFLLLRADTKHLYLEIFSDDTAVKKWEGTAYYKNTERVAPLVALIDPLREGTQALRAMRELRPLGAETATAVKLATTTAVDATDATNAAGRMDNLANNAQKVLDPNSNTLAQITQQQATRKATAAAARAHAEAAAADLAKLQKKAAALQKEVTDYFTLKVHFQEATVTRDATLNIWSVGNYSFNNPFSNNAGEHIGPKVASAPLQALIPFSLSSAAAAGFMHHLYAAVIAVGGGNNKSAKR